MTLKGILCVCVCVCVFFAKNKLYFKKQKTDMVVFPPPDPKNDNYVVFLGGVSIVFAIVSYSPRLNFGLFFFCFFLFVYVRQSDKHKHKHKNKCKDCNGFYGC